MKGSLRYPSSPCSLPETGSLIYLCISQVSWLSGSRHRLASIPPIFPMGVSRSVRHFLLHLKLSICAFIPFLSSIYEQLIFFNGALLLSPECKICVGAKVQRPEDNGELVLFLLFSRFQGSDDGCQMKGLHLLCHLPMPAY